MPKRRWEMMIGGVLSAILFGGIGLHAMFNPVEITYKFAIGETTSGKWSNYFAGVCSLLIGYAAIYFGFRKYDDE